MPLPSPETSLAAPWKLPRYDYVLLPLLSLLTIVGMFAGAEYTTRLWWAENEHDPCTVIKDGSYFHRPNCASRLKNAEGNWEEYRFNACGYRTKAPCGPKPPGSLRIVLLGASTSEGMHVAEEQGLADRTGVALTRLCKRPVEVQNFGIPGGTLVAMYRRMGEILALQPDLILLPITVFDLQEAGDMPVLPKEAMHYKPANVYQRARLMAKESRVVTVVSHYFFQQGSVLLRFYELYGNRSDFLHVPLAPMWETRFQSMDEIVGKMADQFRPKGIPFALLVIPNRTEAALLSSGKHVAGVDPLHFGKRVEDIARKHKILYFDTLREFQRTPDSEKAFYVVDGHLNAQGHAIASQAILKAVQSTPLPGFQECRQGQPSLPQ